MAAGINLLRSGHNPPDTGGVMPDDFWRLSVSAAKRVPKGVPFWACFDQYQPSEIRQKCERGVKTVAFSVLKTNGSRSDKYFVFLSSYLKYLQ